MLSHCEMEVQSKSIKGLNSGQGLGDPSPRGDPDKPSDLPFQRMTRLQALQPPVIFWLPSNTVVLDPQQLIYYWGFFLGGGGECQLAFLSFLFWTGCVDVWYGSKLKTDFFFFFFQTLAEKLWWIWHQIIIMKKKTNKLHHCWIKHAINNSHMQASKFRQKLIIRTTFLFYNNITGLQWAS